MGVTAVYTALQSPGALKTTRPVQYVLEVDLQSESSVVRANVRLVSPLDGSQAWTDRFAIEAADVFKAQDLVAARLSNILAYHLVRLEGERLSKRPVEALSAEELSILGRAALHKFRTRDTLHEAQRFFDAALAKTPDQIEALVGNCLALGFEALGYPSSDTAMKTQAALSSGERAIRIAPALADAHMALGQVYQLTSRLTEAGAEEESAIAINPNLSQSYVILASTRFREGRFEEAIAAGQHQMQINPNDPQALLGPLHIGNSYIGLKRYPEALKWLVLMRTRNPVYWRTLIALASAYALNGEKEKGLDALQDAVKSNPSLSIKFYHNYLKSGVPAFAEFQERTENSLRMLGLKEE